MSGTAFNIDISSGFPCINIVANYGLNSVVEGENNADSWLLFLENSHIIKRSLGDKKYYKVPYKQTLLRKKTPVFKRKQFCLSIEEAKRIARKTASLANHNNASGIKYIDTEFVLSKENTLYFVQIRPLYVANHKKISTIEATNVVPLMKGMYSIPGAAHGKIKIIRNFQDLANGTITINPQDIVVTYRIANYWTPYLTKFCGIVSEEGSVTSHPILICRERNLPCILGAYNAVEILAPLEGEDVSIDGLHKAIYKGKLSIKTSAYDYSKQFEIVPIERSSKEETANQELFRCKRLVKRKQHDWLASPNCILSGPLKDIQMASFQKIKTVLEKANPNSSIHLTNKIKIINGKIYYKLQKSLQEDIKLISHMSLDACERYYQHYVNAFKQFTQVVKRFQLTPQYWKRYKNAFALICAYMWLSFIFRTHVNKQTSIIANRAKIPKYFYEEFCQYIQRHNYQEDNAYLQEKQMIYPKLFSLFQHQGLSTISLDQIQAGQPLLYQDLKNLAFKYKFFQDDDFLHLPNITVLFDNIKNMQSTPFENISPVYLEYFIDNPILQRWIQLSIKAKIIQNNAHHIRVRNLWPIREKLISFAESLVKIGILKTPEEILTKTFDQIYQWLNL